jgi:ABC-2 type transport system ATP-binding protein
VVKSLAALGKTVLLTTHYMDEAQYLADRVAVITEGRIVAEGAPGTLAGRDSARATVSFDLPAGVMPPADLGARRGADGSVEFAPEDLTGALHSLTGWALEQSISLESLRVLRPSLEDVYLELTGPTQPGPANDDSSVRLRTRE